MIPNIYDHLRIQIPRASKLVYLALCIRANKDGLCWPTQEQLAYDTCMSTRNVRRCIINLMELGFIEYVENDGKKCCRVLGVNRTTCPVEEDNLSGPTGQPVRSPPYILNIHRRDIEDTLPAAPVIKDTSNIMIKTTSQIAMEEETSVEDIVSRVKYKEWPVGHPEYGEECSIPTVTSFCNLYLTLLNKKVFVGKTKKSGLTKAETKFIKTFLEKAEDRAVSSLVDAVLHWKALATYLDSNTSAFNLPHQPVAKYFAMYPDDILLWSENRQSGDRPSGGRSEPKVIW